MRSCLQLWSLVFLVLLSIHPTYCRPSSDHTQRFSLSKVALVTGLVGGMLSCFGLGNPFTEHFDTSSDIPESYFRSKTTIRAVVERVTDGDTMRVRHLSGFGSRGYKGTLKDNTIVVRLAAVDTPETAKRGKEGQPFAQEATAFTESKVLGKEVKIKLLSKDQYNRVIGLVKFSKRSWIGLSTEKDLSEELLKEGLAAVYRQGGARYDGSVERWNLLEHDAIKRRKGIWSNGKDKADLPSAFKKKQRAEELVGARNQL